MVSIRTSKVKQIRLCFFLGVTTLCAIIYLSETDLGFNASPAVFFLSKDLPPPITTFQDEVFAPLLSLFWKKAKGELDPALKSFRNGCVPRVLLWTRPPMISFFEPSLVHIRKGQCPLPCEVIFDVEKVKTVDAVIIYLRGAKDKLTVTNSLSPRDPRQPWIMLNVEPPVAGIPNNIHGTPFQEFDGFFNRTMMYRHDSDIQYLNGFIVRRGPDVQVLPAPWVIRGPSPPPLSEMEKKNQLKKLSVTFISNCGSAKSNRLQYIHKFQKYAKVDIYGKCGDKTCGHSMYVNHRYNVTEDKCLKMAGENYLFYFAFENNLCVDYVTEKLYNLLFYPIVPVVRGSANYSKILPPMSYIDATKYSPKELAKKLLYLQSNPKEYQKYLEWRNHYQSSTMGGERNLCHLCARLYDPEFYEHQIIEDFDDWLLSKSHCYSEILE